MAVSLEWVTMPNGFRFRTICKNGVPWIEPTRFLMRHGHVGRGSSRTVDTYAERLLPFFRWVVQEELALSDVDQRGFHRFRRDLTIHDTSRPPLLKKGPDSSEVTVRSTVTMAARFLEWCGPEYHGSERPLLRVRNVPTSFRDAIGTFNSIRAGLPRAKHKLPKVLTAQQVDKCRDWIMDTYAFDAALQVRNRAIFELFVGGAVRLGALLGLRTDNILWTERTILLSYTEVDYRMAWGNKQHHSRTAKTGEYMIAVGSDTWLWLNRYFMESRPAEAVRFNHGIFFCEHRPGTSKHGTPIRFTTVRYLFRSLSKPQSDGGVGIHMLRHTWAALYIEPAGPTFKLSIGGISRQHLLMVGPFKARHTLAHKAYFRWERVAKSSSNPRPAQGSFFDQLPLG